MENRETRESQENLRQGFHSIGKGGLNWNSFPLRLFTKGNAKFWNPADIDLGREAEDFGNLTEMQQQSVLSLATLFIAGEEAVTEDIQPFIRAMATEGRFGDEIYLTQFCFEEAKHVEVFRRWLDALGISDDLHTWVADNSGYRKLFYEELPASLQALDSDPSPASQVRASVTYNHVIEGSLALTGYWQWNRLFTEYGIFPGMRQIIKHIGDDERRHMAWGTFTCRRHVAADDRMWEVVTQRFDELVPYAVELIEVGNARFPEDPFDRDVQDTVAYARDRAMRRLGAIESARGVPVERIDVDASPEELEERFGREDAAELATLGG
ncbi:MAG: R2-like ligand-binding oxidase [Streptosporangiales bacterium]|nr:R2-like ligand-binding oxidase [Streptosporangiales bacterium]